MSSNADVKSNTPGSRVSRFTPRQLIKYHMEHPEIPISDEDIENLILDFPDLGTWNNAHEDDDNFTYINKNNTPTTFLLL